MKEEKGVSWSSQQIIKQILSAFQRTAGRQSKYTFDVNAIVAAMSNVSGNQNDSYRESNSIWGEILVELGIRNKFLPRKNLYLRRHDNRNGMRSAIEHGRVEVRKVLIICLTINGL